jgi:amidase
MNSAPKSLDRSHIIYLLDRETPPALEIDSGDTVVFETHDARTGTIRSNQDLLDHAHPDGSNPATGPVWIREAQPVDSLAVEILDIQLADKAFVAVKKGVGLLSDRAQNFATRVTEIRDGNVNFSPSLRFPTRPMIGVIGTAPASEAVETAFPGAHGGNMDNRYVTKGATIHLPIGVPGALFALGDVHAAMGDGEITMVGLEAAARVTARVRLLKGVTVRRPWIESNNHWVTTGDDPDPAKALKIAATEMVLLLQDKLNLSFEDTYMLMSASCDVQICQACDPGKFPITTRAVFPRLDRQST